MSIPPPNSAPNDERLTPESTAAQRQPLFASRPPEKQGIPWMAWGAAGLAIVLVLAAILLFTHQKAGPPPNTILPPAVYAASLPVSDITMSESTSLSGGKSTFIDGHIHNTGNATVTGATVQVLFANDEAMPPQVETLPLTLIRTRQPYVDIEPLSAAPIAPGEDREFRLIFENVSASWNQQLPAIHVVGVTTK